MKDPKFSRVKPNYHKNAFEIALGAGKRKKNYSLPFALVDPSPSMQNRVASLAIDKELRNTVVQFALQDGTLGEFPSDFVLYHCEPSYDWSPVTQIHRRLNGRLKSKLSPRVVEDAFRMYPSETLRLLEGNLTSKFFPDIVRLAKRAGYFIGFTLKKQPAA
jgi:hypothetical protein